MTHSLLVQSFSAILEIRKHKRGEEALYKVISIEEALCLPKQLFIDVRTPAEFAEGHLPKAINIPIFSNEERALVGTLYKQVSVEAAKQQGLEIVSPKLPSIIKQITEYGKQHYQIVIYCWRGGMRSQSIASISDMLGVSVHQLRGGYKSYRRYVLDHLESLELKGQTIVLCGSTGVGKTTLLKNLKAQEVPVLDLEGLANHRGSVFGQIGLGKSTSAPLFDAAILKELQNLQAEPYFFVECESKRIGNVYIPNVLFEKMKQGRKILVQASIPTRAQRLITEYTNNSEIDATLIQQSIQAISRKLGKKKTTYLLERLANKELEPLVTTLLTDYYDLLYGFEKSDHADYEVVLDAENLDKATADIIEYFNQLKKGS